MTFPVDAQIYAKESNSSGPIQLSGETVFEMEMSGLVCPLFVHEHASQSMLIRGHLT